MLTAAAYDLHVERLLDRMRRLHAALDAEAIPYRIVGGMATFIHVSERDPERARLTADVDAGILRADLPRVIAAAERYGFRFRHVAGVDMLLDAGARSAAHLIFVEAIPASDPVRTREGILVASVADLVLMKLTSHRLKDKVHIQDLDGVGLITPEIEDGLSAALRARLAEIRATE
jgi:hypothetical protein